MVGAGGRLLTAASGLTVNVGCVAMFVQFLNRLATNDVNR